jgi:hypothetical protein
LGDILKKHEKAIGASGTDVIGQVHNQDDHIEQLKGYEAAEVYDKMRRSDTQVRKIITAITNPIKSATWAVEPASEETKDLESAALIEQILFKDIDFKKFLNECLTMVPHGYSMFEVVHMNREAEDFGPYTGLGQLGFRRQATIIEWFHDRVTGALQKVKQEANGDIEVDAEIPAEFLLMFYSEQEGDNIGFPLLRNVYGPYKRKLLATELQYIGMERFAIPTPVVEVPKTVKIDSAEYKKAIKVVKGFTSAEDSFIAYPEGWKLVLQSNNFDPTKIAVVLKAEDENMASAILGSFLELGTGGNTGAYALSADLSDFFFAGLTYYADIILDIMNRCLIPQLLKLNFGDEYSEVMPKLTYSGITDNAGLELMQVITGLTASGIVSKDEQLEDHVRRVFNLPKKAKGEMVENQTTDDEPTTTPDKDGKDGDGGSDNNNNNSNDNPLDSVSLSGGRSQSVALAELGHTHKNTGPNIKKGKKHYHETLDKDGNVTGRTQLAEDTADHTHVIDANKKTGKPIEVKETKEPTKNPKTLIEGSQLEMAEVIRRHLFNISDKYIADVLRKYKDLSDANKLKATEGIKIGGVAKFRKELESIETVAASKSYDMAKSEVPDKKNVKLSEDLDALRLEFSMDNFKFNDFKKLPKRVQILIASQASLLSEKEAQSVTDAVAFQFNSSEASTDDIEVLRQDLKQAASDNINSGAKDVVAADLAATIVNETRNTFLLAPEVQESLASYTFVNSDPKTDICKTLAGVTFGAEDTDLVRYQPPLHHNCKSYIRANLKTSKNLPEVTGLPAISDSAKASIKFKDGL